LKNDRKKEEKRKQGRPSKSEAPRVPWDKVDELLVHGEKDENGDLDYPSFRNLAERFDVSHSSISKYAKQHNCLSRRKDAEKRKHELSDIKLGKLRAEESALKRDDMIRAIERFLIKFEQALVEDRVRCDNPTDYNTMVRLRAFVMGDADARTDLVAGLTLDDLIAAHAEYREAMIDSTPEMRGEVVPISGNAVKKSRKKPPVSRGDREPLR
jgi:hypothetical protein